NSNPECRWNRKRRSKVRWDEGCGNYRSSGGSRGRCSLKRVLVMNKRFVQRALLSVARTNMRSQPNGRMVYYHDGSKVLNPRIIRQRHVYISYTTFFTVAYPCD
ncbi:unnamed protein product, partial [Pylaiella littoralis]